MLDQGCNPTTLPDSYMILKIYSDDSHAFPPHDLQNYSFIPICYCHFLG